MTPDNAVTIEPQRDSRSLLLVAPRLLPLSVWTAMRERLAQDLADGKPVILDGSFKLYQQTDGRWQPLD